MQYLVGYYDSCLGHALTFCMQITYPAISVRIWCLFHLTNCLNGWRNCHAGKQVEEWETHRLITIDILIPIINIQVSIIWFPNIVTELVRKIWKWYIDFVRNLNSWLLCWNQDSGCVGQNQILFYWLVYKPPFYFCYVPHFFQTFGLIFCRPALKWSYDQM